MDIDKQHADIRFSAAKDQNSEGAQQTTDGLTTRRSPESAERQRRAIAMRVGSLAIAGHHAAGDLEEQFPEVARHLRDAATGFEHISNLLKDPHLDLSNSGGRQPVAIMAGVVLVGLGLAWLLSSSGDSRTHPAVDPSANDGERGSYGIR